jgi:hypothetical protein
MTTPATPTIKRLSSIELHFDVTDFPVVEAEYFKPVLAETMEVALLPRRDGSLYVARIQLRGWAAKKDGTQGNARGNLWFNPDREPDKVPTWLLNLVSETCAPYLAKESRR